MSSRRDYFYRQLVAEDELDDGFTGLENADRAIIADNGILGILSLGVVSQHAGTPNISVDVTGPCVVYDQSGQRVVIPSLQNKDVSVDDSSVSTNVAVGGNEKWVSLFVKFDRALSDVRTDGNSNSVYFVRDESFKFSVIQGAEAAIGVATKPALLSDGLLLADINRTNGQTQILNANISTTRRQDAFVVSGSPHPLRRGLIKDAFSDILGWLNGHLSAAADRHAAAAIDYAGGVSWAGGTSPTNPAATVEAQLDKILNDLSVTTAAASGADRIGTGALAGTATTIGVGTLFAALTALKLAANIEYAGGGSWAGGTSPTNPATSVELQIDKIITDLTASTTGASGADRIAIAARTTWLGGRTNVATTIFAAVDKIITDLAATTASDDGSERIGAQATTGFSAGSVRSQLDEMLSGTQTFTGAKTFDNITVSAAHDYKLSSRTVGPITEQAPMEIGGTNLIGVRVSVVVNATSNYQPLNLPDGSTLTAVAITVDPANATPPAGVAIGFKVTKRSMVDGTSTDVFATFTDPTAGASYGPVHSFSKTGLSEVIDRATYKYFVECVGESGSGASTVTWYGSQWTATVAKIAQSAT